MTVEPSPRSRPQARWTAEELKLLEELAEEKNRQKLARQNDSTQKVTLSWRAIGDRLGGRDSAAVQARYSALVKQRQLERDASTEVTSPSVPRDTPDQSTTSLEHRQSIPSDDCDRTLEDLLSEVRYTLSNSDATNRSSTGYITTSTASSSQDTHVADDKVTNVTRSTNENSDESALNKPRPRVITLRMAKGLPERASRELGAAKTARQLGEEMALEKEPNDGKNGSPRRRVTTYIDKASGRPMKSAAQTIEEVSEHQAPVAPMGQQRMASSAQSSPGESGKATDWEAVRAKWLAEGDAAQKRRDASQAAQKEDDVKVLQLAEMIEDIKRVKALKREADDDDERGRAKREKREELERELAALIAED